jgi:two-component system OmpR family sensor kinase
MRSIRRKLLAVLVAVMTGFLLIGAWATYAAAREEADAMFDYHLEQIARALASRDFGGPAGALAADERFDFVVRIWTRDGLFIFPPDAARDFPELVLPGLSTVRTASGQWRIFALQGRGQTIAVAQPTAVRARLAASAALRTVSPFLVLLPLVIALIFLTVARELRPLVGLARAVAGRTPEALEPITATDVPAEVRPLVDALNDLLVRLRAALDAQRDFVADAAHELRTPLAALQLQAGLIERSTDAGERLAAVSELKAGVARAAHTVSQLLTLARNEPGAHEQALVPVALGELLRQGVVSHAVLADARQIDLGATTLDPAASVAGDREALGSLIDNLLANAIAHAPAGGRIDVACGLDDGHPWLAVADNGPGIPADERARVFDRFYRRSGAAAGGTGLGLAIVGSIARRHGAEIVLADTAGGGLTVRVTFPKETRSS